ncbi:MAG TPA: hypothetical protein VFK43_05730 [Acidimicrobiales bacterium]|nr:hypothetical protein [Acidimicrobiales bacterium]
MADVGRTRSRRSPTRLLVAGALLSATLLACGRPAPVEVAVSGLPPAPPPASEPATVFQGSVASVDAGAGLLVVDVTIVWTPVITAGGHQRRVLIGAGTRWERGLTLAGLRGGDEVQVDAADAVDGSWPALRVRLFDID